MSHMIIVWGLIATVSSLHIKFKQIVKVDVFEVKFAVSCVHILLLKCA